MVCEGIVNADGRFLAQEADGVGRGDLLTGDEIIERFLVWLFDRHRFDQCKTAGDKEAVDVFTHSAFDVGENAVADREDAVVGDVCSQRGQSAAGEVVDRRVRFAEVEALSTHFYVELSERPATPFAGVTAIHNDIRIGAEEFQTTVNRVLEVRPVHTWIGLCVEGAETSNSCRLVQWYTGDVDRVFDEVEPLEEDQVIVLAHEPDLVPNGALEHGRARAVTAGGDDVPAIASNADLLELFFDRRPRAGSIRQKDDFASFGSEGSERFDCVWERLDPVVEAPPEVAEDRVVSVGNFREAFDDGDVHVSVRLSVPG